MTYKKDTSYFKCQHRHRKWDQRGKEMKMKGRGLIWLEPCMHAKESAAHVSVSGEAVMTTRVGCWY